jgi:hypothetical protein
MLLPKRTSVGQNVRELCKNNISQQNYIRVSFYVEEWNGKRSVQGRDMEEAI